jgi:renalase
MRVIVVGAGISGLVTARELQGLGVDVLVVDKGRSPGGRLATRRVGDAVLDHGAQFFTVRTPAFQRRVDDWIARDLVTIWANGFGAADGHPRYVATAGMNTLAKDLAVGVDVSCSTMAFAIRPATGAARPWHVVIDDGTIHDADHVVVTTPLPQAFALLADSGVELDEQLLHTDYDRTIALLALLAQPSLVPPPGGVQGPNDDVSFVADNQRKGVSGPPALTLHASATWSTAHWDDDTETLLPLLFELARPWVTPGSIVEAQVKKWRFATPQRVWPEPCWRSADGGIVLAGDAFDGPRVEAAHNSGLAAAHALTQ